MSSSNVKTDKYKILWIIAFAVISFTVAFLMYWRLGVPSVASTDEATHGVNAYEMLQNHTWLVNTYRYEVDYFNSKPPLSLWLIMLNYKLFGVGTFGLRFASATFGLLTYLLISQYVIRKQGMVNAVLFGLMYVSSSALYNYHCYRAGDMDSIYMFFFSIAMLALMEINDYGWMLYIYGAALGLGMLTKGLHAGIIFVIGLFSIPVIKKALTVKRVLVSALISIAILLVWAIPRFMYDGWTFFYYGIFEETGREVGTGNEDLTYPYRFLIRQKSWFLLVVLTAAALVIAVIIRKKDKFDVKKFLNEHLVLLLWILVPVVLYGISGNGSEWYRYPSYVGVCMAAPLLARYILRKLSILTDKKLLNRIGAAVMTICFLGVSVSNCASCIWHDWEADKGGSILLQLKSAIESLENEHSDAIPGANIYIQTSHNGYKADGGEWENDALFYAETITNGMCADGGVDAFLQDEGSILILDKDLWDTYSPVLAGHVILVDNGYLIFSTDLYGQE